MAFIKKHCIMNSKRISQINSVSTFYVTLLIFWTLFQIINILTYNNILSQLGVVPMVCLQTLYTIAWVVVLFCGRRLGLNVFGYVGAGIMIITSVYALCVSLYPLQVIMTDMGLSWQHVSMISNLLGGISTVFSILGIFLFLFGARASLLLSLVTPCYFILSFFLNMLIPVILGWLGVTMVTAVSGCSILMLLFILIILFPVFIVWRNATIALARAETF